MKACTVCFICMVHAVHAFAPASLPSVSPTTWTRRAATRAEATTNSEEIEVVRQPDSDFLESKGVFDWGTWGCGVSKFPWTYGEAESCYLLEGDVTVTPADGRQAVTFGKGDFVTFPAGMTCTWDVRAAVKKHLIFY